MILIRQTWEGFFLLLFFDKNKVVVACVAGAMSNLCGALLFYRAVFKFFGVKSVSKQSLILNVVEVECYMPIHLFHFFLFNIALISSYCAHFNRYFLNIRAAIVLGLLPVPKLD